MALVDNVQDFVAELDQVESIFYTCRGARTVSGYTLPYVPTEEGCLFAVWDAWTRFLRGLLISCCSGVAVGLGGSVYRAPLPMTERELLAYLIANRRGRTFGIINGEPKWNSSAAVADIAAALNLPNQNTLVSAITASSVSLGPIVVVSPLEEIRLARNFAAHKNPSTLADIAAFSQNGFPSLTAHLRGLRSGVEAFSVWKECLIALAEAAAQ